MRSRDPTLALVGPCRLTTLQSGELRQIDCVRAPRRQERVDERVVAELVLSIVVDILGHVRVKVVQGGGVGRAAPSGQSRKFAGSGLDSAEFGVLQPQVLLDLFDRGQEPENCSVSLVEPAIFGDCGRDVGQQPGSTVAPAAVTIPFVMNERRSVPACVSSKTSLMVFSFWIAKLISRSLLFEGLELAGPSRRCRHQSTCEPTPAERDDVPDLTSAIRNLRKAPVVQTTRSPREKRDAPGLMRFRSVTSASPQMCSRRDPFEHTWTRQWNLRASSQIGTALTTHDVFPP